MVSVSTSSKLILAAIIVLFPLLLHAQRGDTAHDATETTLQQQSTISAEEQVKETPIAPSETGSAGATLGVPAQSVPAVTPPAIESVPTSGKSGPAPKAAAPTDEAVSEASLPLSENVQAKQPVAVPGGFAIIGFLLAFVAGLLISRVPFLNRRLHLSTATVPGSHFVQGPGITTTGGLCGTVFECPICHDLKEVCTQEAGHKGPHGPATVHGCRSKVTCHRCGTTFNKICSDLCGHEGDHWHVPDHKCPGRVSCTSCSGFFGLCQEKCGHDGAHTSPPVHPCRWFPQCTVCGEANFFGTCANNCGHEGSHGPMKAHRCATTIQCKVCRQNVPCGLPCPHKGAHEIGSHRCQGHKKCPGCGKDIIGCYKACGHSGDHDFESPVHHTCNAKLDCIHCGKKGLECTLFCTHHGPHLARRHMCDATVICHCGMVTTCGNDCSDGGNHTPSYHEHLPPPGSLEWNT